MKKSLIILVILIIVSAGLIIIFDKKETKEEIPVDKVVEENKSNPEMAVFVSDKLGIEFTYPESLSTLSINDKDERFSVKVSELENKLIVDAGNLGNSYAFIYHKNSSETFEQAILREFVKPEYQNKPCVVEQVKEDTYRLTFPGDSFGADNMEEPGSSNMKKCWTNQTLMWNGNFTADPVTGGFYIAFNGGQSPVFSIDSSSWWPKGIKFIK